MEQSKNKLSIVVFVLTSLLILFSTAFGYYKYVVKGDFYIYAQVSCNPEIEDCFNLELEEEGERYFYKIIYKKAYDIPTCNPLDSIGCAELTCEPTEDCYIITCSEDNKSEYQSTDYCS